MNSSTLLLLGGAWLLSSRSPPPTTQQSNAQALAQAADNPLSAGKYLNEDEIGTAIMGATNARDALNAAIAASQVETITFDGKVFAVNRDTNIYPEKTLDIPTNWAQRWDAQGQLLGDRSTLLRAVEFAKDGLTDTERQWFGWQISDAQRVLNRRTDPVLRAESLAFIDELQFIGGI